MKTLKNIILEKLKISSKSQFSFIDPSLVGDNIEFGEFSDLFNRELNKYNLTLLNEDNDKIHKYFNDNEIVFMLYTEENGFGTNSKCYNKPFGKICNGTEPVYRSPVDLKVKINEDGFSYFFNIRNPFTYHGVKLRPLYFFIRYTRSDKSIAQQNYIFVKELS